MRDFLSRILFALGVSLALLLAPTACDGDGAGGGGTGFSRQSWDNDRSGAAGGRYTLEMVLDAAARFGTCGDGPGFLFFAETAAMGSAGGWSAEFFAELLPCVLSARSCAAVLACEGFDTSAPCDPSTFRTACVGGHSVSYCHELSDERSVVRTVRCGSAISPGATCRLDDEGSPRCGLGPCEGWGESCDGDLLKMCDEGLLLAVDCSALGEGYACAMTEEDRAECRSRERCTTSSCEGSTLAFCEDDSVAARVDCRWFGPGFACHDTGGGASCFLPPERRDCEGGGPALCVGSRVRLCVFGRQVVVDCAWTPGATCVARPQDDWGSDDDDGARCVLP